VMEYKCYLVTEKEMAQILNALRFCKEQAGEDSEHKKLGETLSKRKLQHGYWKP